MLALALWLAGFDVAHAEPPPTLVLITPPTPLVDAVTTGLGPWQIRVVVVTAPTPADRAATTHRATYVATVRGTTLELFHVGEPGVQTRDVPAVIDDVEAASIALTIKTWMRLGPPPTAPDGTPPPDATPPPSPILPPPPPPPPRLAGFAAVGLGVRLNQGSFGARERLVLAAGAPKIKNYTNLSACSRSSMRSSKSSTPMLRRMSESLRPVLRRSSRGMEACVLEAGCPMSDSTPPSDSARVKI